MTHVDDGSLDWAIEKVCTTKSVSDVYFLDVGCGVMGMIDMAISRGTWACGLDADIRLLGRDELKNMDRLYISDFRKTHVSFPIHFDIIWSVEVGEHISDGCVDNYIKTLANVMRPRMKHHPYYCASILIFSAAPVTGNVKHCNEQAMDYWLEKFAAYNIIPQEDMTRELRAASTMKRNFVRSNGFVFIQETNDAS